MKIKIFNEKNKSKIEEQIEKAQKRCTARTIGFYDLERELKRAIKNIEFYEIPKKNRHLIKLKIDCHAQKFASSYKYPAYSTVFHVEFNSVGEPLLTEVKRDYCDERVARWSLVDQEKKEALKDILYKNFRI